MSTQAEYKFIIRFIALHRIVVCNVQEIGERAGAATALDAPRTNECKTRRESSDMCRSRINEATGGRTFLKELPVVNALRY